MTFDEYQAAAAATAVYSRQAAGLYPLLGLVGECAEVVEKFYVAQNIDPAAPAGYLVGTVNDALYDFVRLGHKCEGLKKVVRGTREDAVEPLLRNGFSLPDPLPPEYLAGVKKELGDVLWYLSAVARDHGLFLGDCAAANLAKLKLRKETGTLHGSGDDRELAGRPPDAADFADQE